MAGAAFKHEMLRIVLSDFDEGQEKPTTGVVLEHSDSPVSIEMLCAELAMKTIRHLIPASKQP